jgi:nucleoside-diphosphate-sugar epimerase
MSKTILVTGGCGWLGAEITRTLLTRGDAVVAMDIAVSPAMAALAAQQPRLTVVTADLGEWAQVLRLLQHHRPDGIIHAAAIVGVIQAAAIPIKALRVTVEGAVNLFEAMRLTGIKRVVHVSTEETYGDFQAPMISEDHSQNPTSVYGLTKLAVEHYGRVFSQEHGLECINARTCWVYGPHLPRLRMPRTFIEAALRGEPFHQPDGASFAVDQVYIASYNIATGAAPTLRDTAEAVNRAIPGARITVGDAPYRHGGTVLSAVKGALDIARAQGELGYQPRYDLQRGIEATIAATG